MIEYWKNLLFRKKQCVTWKDEVIDKTIIEDLLNDVHNYCNSKQNRVPYEILAMDWSDPEARSKIFHHCYDTAGNHYNTQVLAPWIIILHIKHDMFPDDMQVVQLYREAGVEIGLVAQMIALGATARNLDIGFCKCFDDKHREEIQKMLGKKTSIDLIIGIGHYENKTHQRDLYTNKEYKAIISTSHNSYGDPRHVKPVKNTYIKFWNNVV